MISWLRTVFNLDLICVDIESSRCDQGRLELNMDGCSVEQIEIFEPQLFWVMKERKKE
jgi:hypothetical protein